MKSVKTQLAGIDKCPTGIRGLDEITNGGLPKGRPTLVCGGAGSGKTLLAMEFIVRGARDYGEPGVFVAFEENTDELAANVATLGFDLPAMVEEQKLALDYVRIEHANAAGRNRLPDRIWLVCAVDAKQRVPTSVEKIERPRA